MNPLKKITRDSIFRTNNENPFLFRLGNLHGPFIGVFRAKIHLTALGQGKLGHVFFGYIARANDL